MPEKAKINLDLKQRVKKYEDKIQRLKHKYSVDPVITLEFPQYRVLPDDLVLALKIIEKHGHKFMLTYKDLKDIFNEH